MFPMDSASLVFQSRNGLLFLTEDAYDLPPQETIEPVKKIVQTRKRKPEEYSLFEVLSSITIVYMLDCWCCIR